jgi:hypothetical protein
VNTRPDTFTCPGCAKEVPANQAEPIPVVATLGILIITFGGVVFGRLCPECRGNMVGIAAIGVLVGVVILIVAGSKWLWG